MSVNPLMRLWYKIDGLITYLTDPSVKSTDYKTFLSSINTLSKMAAVVWRNEYTEDVGDIWQKPPNFFNNRNSSNKFIGDCEDLAMLLLRCAMENGMKAELLTVFWPESGHAICYFPDLHTTVCTYGRIDHGEGATIDDIASYYNKYWYLWRRTEMNRDDYSLRYIHTTVRTFKK